MSSYMSHGRWGSARRCEQDNDWRGAAKIWRELGEHKHAEACELILESNEKGDRWRLRVKQLMATAQEEAYRQATFEIYGPHDET